MPGDELKLNLRLTADGKGFVGEVRVAKRELDKLAGGTRKASGATTEYTRTARRATAANRGFGKSFLDAHGHTLKYLGGIGSITLATRGLVRHADSYTQISNAVRIATGSAAEHAQVSDELFGIAQRTRQPLTAVADLYQKLSISAADLGASNADMLGVIEGVGQALVINGTSATQASGALLQLSQALGGGVVRAEELNSVLENAKPILIAAANHIDRAGGSVSKLRELVAQGETGYIAARAYSRATSHNAARCLEHVIDTMPFAITAIQADSGSEFRGAFEHACQHAVSPCMCCRPEAPNTTPAWNAHTALCAKSSTANTAMNGTCYP